MNCPVCGDPLQVFFELAGVPVFCNVLHDTRASAADAPRGDIALGHCAGCGMIHNTAFDPARVEYAEGYENSLHCSPRFQEYAEELAARLIDKYRLDGAEVVELGAHRGEFLALLCAGGRNHGVGYDPSSPASECEVPGRPFRLVREYFGAGTVDRPVDLICCRHVLEHVNDPRGFVRTMVSAAGSSATYLEVPNGLWTLRDLGIWDIIYEHCSYFVPTALRRLFLEHGVDPHLREAFGGQFLSAEHPAAPDAPLDEAAAARELEELERQVQVFSHAYRERLGSWRDRLAEAEQSGKGLAIWGAGSKGVTFLNALGESAAIRGVVDINPRKQGKFVAGTGHEIVAPEQLVRAGVDRVVVMNPLYLQEIRGSLVRLGFGGEVEAIG